MENSELILLELEDFNLNYDEHKQITQHLENFIEHVAKTGTYTFPWQKIRNLYLHKLKYVLNNITPSSASHVSTTTTTTISSMTNSLSPTTTTLSLNSTVKNEVETEATFNTSNSFYTFVQNFNIADLTHIKVIKDRIIERMESFNSAPFTIQRISELLIKPNNHYNRPDKYLRGLEKCIMVVTTIDPIGQKIFVEDFLYKNYSQSQQIQNTSSIAQESQNTNIETSQVKSEEALVPPSPQLIQQQSLSTSVAIDNQQNEMDISTTTSTITNVSSIDSNENSENEENLKESNDVNIDNRQVESMVSDTVEDAAIIVTENETSIDKVEIAIDNIEKPSSETIATDAMVTTQESTPISTDENPAATSTDEMISS